MSQQIRVNVRATVNSAQIRRERTKSGRQVIIVPSATLPDDVIMNGVLYPADEITKSFQTLEGTPAPLGHPQVDGQLINARDPDAINGYWVGAHNANVRQEGGRVLLDKVIDIEVAERTEGGRRLIDAVNSGQPIHTSTGLLCKQYPAPLNAEGYKWIARDLQFDHDAILLDEPGAATPEQGVGMLVNGQNVQVMWANVDDAVLTADASLDQLRDRLRKAVSSAAGEGGHAYVIDFSDDRVVYGDDRNNQLMSRTYADDGTTVTLTGGPEQVTKRVSWIKSLPIVNSLLRLINSDGANPKSHSKEVPEMDEKQLEAILAANAQVNAEALATAIAPLVETVKSMTDTFQANNRAAESAKRAEVETVLGKEAADALTGNALDEAHKRLVTGSPAAMKANGAAVNGRDAYNTAPED